MTRVLATVGLLFAAGALLLHGVHVRRGVDAARRRRDWLKYAVYVAIVNALWASVYAGPWLLALLLAAIGAAGLAELRAVGGSWPVAVLVVAGLAHLLLPAAGGFVFVVLVTAAADSFAEVGGRLVGRRPLCPRLSPNKTVEGLVLGLLGATAVATLLAFVLPATPLEAAGRGLAVALAAVAGDLVFSAVKRSAGVKDFSAVLPGHGGVLDRFDSLIVAAPVAYWLGVLLS